jgi:hypothetical protein
MRVLPVTQPPMMARLLSASMLASAISIVHIAVSISMLSALAG